jgi:hypothetical protein
MIAAMETLAPLAVKMAVEAIDRSGNPLVFMPLHKGAEGRKKTVGPCKQEDNKNG